MPGNGGHPGLHSEVPSYSMRPFLFFKRGYLHIDLRNIIFSLCSLVQRRRLFKWMSGNVNSVRTAAPCLHDLKGHSNTGSRRDGWKEVREWEKMDETRILVHMMLQVFSSGANANPDPCWTGTEVLPGHLTRAVSS